MPMVHIHNAGPLTEEQRAQMAREVTEAICRSTGKPPASVYLRIDEVPRDHFAVGGIFLATRDRERSG